MLPQNPKWLALLVFASLLLLTDATQALTLAKHGKTWKRGDYHEWTSSVGIVCKCCHGEGAAAKCTPTLTPAAAAAACSNLRCLPWKFS